MLGDRGQSAHRWVVEFGMQERESDIEIQRGRGRRRGREQMREKEGDVEVRESEGKINRDDNAVLTVSRFVHFSISLQGIRSA